jgi:hypothetical protein
LARLASTVCGPALSARCTARTPPARSTTVAVTAWPLVAQAATVAAAIWLASGKLSARSLRRPWARVLLASSSRAVAVTQARTGWRVFIERLLFGAAPRLRAVPSL